MIDIVGNIKIDPADKVRLKYLLASIRSFAFLKDYCRFKLNVEGINPSSLTSSLISHELAHCKFNYEFSIEASETYGKTWLKMMHGHQHFHPKYILNFHEDHFCVLDGAATLLGMLIKMNQFNVSVCKASFSQIEYNSHRTITPLPGSDNTSQLVFDNNLDNHREYCRHYGNRYYIGTNFIVARQFAKKFWGRPIISKRPHEYEVPDYTPYLQHIAMIPFTEITAAIDDDHGEENTCLLKRDNKKFWDIYNSINL